MNGVAFTPCTLRCTHGAVPEPGTFLITAGGSAYRVDRVAGRMLHCTRWPLDEVPADADVWSWTWDRREAA